MKQKLMPLYDKIMLRKRNVIESVNDMLKNVAQIVHTRHRKKRSLLLSFALKSERGDSNARPLRPERSALPTALHPDCFGCDIYVSKASAKVQVFSDIHAIFL